jgi:hypothetical protein
MKSLVSMQLFVKPGDKVKATVDCFSFGGVVVLVNADTPQLLEDYARLHCITTDLFVI